MMRLALPVMAVTVALAVLWLLGGASVVIIRARQ